MTRRRKIMFAIVAMAMAMGGMLIALLLADLYLHHRAERSAGLNRWGYRGPVAGRKQPGEVRVALLGGSTTFGYGVPWQEAVPALLEARLRERSGGQPFTAINLGFNNEGAFASEPTLQDYAWLDYDIVVLYHGYNDLLGDPAQNRAVFRHASPVFRLTGYYPILPLYLQEKAMALRAGGDLEAAYQAAREGAPKVTFSPNVAQRTTASALEALSGAVGTLGDGLDRVAARSTPGLAANEAGCEAPWVQFCNSIHAAARYARSRGAAVVVIAQPAVTGGKTTARLDEQRVAMAAMLSREFSGDRGVVYVDLSRAVDLKDPDISFDGLHLGLRGNGIIADALVEPVLALSRTPGS
jgi:hypothetical protein